MQAEAFASGGGQNGHIRHNPDNDRIRAYEPRQRRDNEEASVSQRERGHGRAFEIRLSQHAQDLVRASDSEHGAPHRARHAPDGERDGHRHRHGHHRGHDRGHEHGQGYAFGRVFASALREGLQTMLRALGLGDTANSGTTSGDIAEDTAQASTAATAAGTGTTTVTSTVTAGDPAHPAEAASAESSGNDDILGAFSQRLANAVQAGLQTMFHLLGFGREPEAANAGLATATDATATTDDSASSQAKSASADAGARARAEHPGFERAMDRFARFLAAGFMIGALADGLRSLKEQFGSDGSEPATDQDPAAGKQAEATVAGGVEPAPVDIAA